MPGAEDRLTFVPLPEPTTEKIEELMLKVARRLTTVVLLGLPGQDLQPLCFLHFSESKRITICWVTRFVVLPGKGWLSKISWPGSNQDKTTAIFLTGLLADSRGGDYLT
ncbi:MAG: hypothetical protein KAY24_05555 [Candidatus Eisenbacteria sp.]|nr:hypothetical protein [Candidatus Eisenbacteria bacterium]